MKLRSRSFGTALAAYAYALDLMIRGSTGTMVSVNRRDGKPPGVTLRRLPAWRIEGHIRGQDAP
jgi:hypothetical protein